MRFEIKIIYRFLRSKRKFTISVDDNLSIEEIGREILNVGLNYPGMYVGPEENFILTAGTRSIYSISVEELKEFASAEKVIMTQLVDISSFNPRKSEEISNIYLNSSQIGIVSLSEKYKITREDIDTLNEGYPLRIDRTLLIPQDETIKVVSSCNNTYMDFILEKEEIIRELYDLFP